MKEEEMEEREIEEEEEEIELDDEEFSYNKKDYITKNSFSINRNISFCDFIYCFINHPFFNYVNLKIKNNKINILFSKDKKINKSTPALFITDIAIEDYFYNKFPKDFSLLFNSNSNVEDSDYFKFIKNIQNHYGSTK
ncbi:MAG: hypothetical protein LKE30_07645 [Bacteroidales bacterium]|jgi:hypothetical protein|nr:hypothetical protein [Bacteroidales bacterium]